MSEQRVRCTSCLYQGSSKAGYIGICPICFHPTEQIGGLPVILPPPGPKEPFTPEQVRWIREEVDRALHPGMPDPRTFLDAEVRDPETGHRYRGTLYLIERTEVDET
jgi:hypothetical protein